MTLKNGIFRKQGTENKYSVSNYKKKNTKSRTKPYFLEMCTRILKLQRQGNYNIRITILGANEDIATEEGHVGI